MQPVRGEALLSVVLYTFKIRCRGTNQSKTPHVFQPLNPAQHKAHHKPYPIHLWQILPTPNIFEPAPNTILKFRKYPLFQKSKSRIDNNTFCKNKY